MFSAKINKFLFYYNVREFSFLLGFFIDSISAMKEEWMEAKNKLEAELKGKIY
jgi:hypothetical protein